jgi:hypothetical protein
MVERFFRDLTENGLRRGVFTSVEKFRAATFEYIETTQSSALALHLDSQIQRHPGKGQTGNASSS